MGQVSPSVNNPHLGHFLIDCFKSNKAAENSWMSSSLLSSRAYAIRSALFLPTLGSLAKDSVNRFIGFNGCIKNQDLLIYL